MIDFASGVIDGPGIVTARRTLADLGGLFADQAALAALDPNTVVYETHGYPEPESGSPALLAATTVLYPGRVGREAFMTRGHFHVDPTRGESCFTLRGSGLVLLRDRSGAEQRIAMEPGSLAMIEGRFAHRVANVGDEPLVFLVTWLSDCGHDYAEVAAWPRGSWSVGV
jgi:glucose-6-phosphate isomerase